MEEKPIEGAQVEEYQNRERKSNSRNDITCWNFKESGQFIS